MLDTNVCIYIARRRPESVLARFQRLRPGEAVLSVVTFGELQFGAAKSRDMKAAQTALAELATLLPVQPMPADVAVEYGGIRAHLEQQGRPVGGNDLWIAAHARTAGLVLVTDNEREFARIPGLRLQNWIH